MPKETAVSQPEIKCPNCQSRDALAHAMITSPDPMKPWKQIKRGSVLECCRCGMFYCVSPEGVYQPGLAVKGSGGGSMPRAKVSGDPGAALGLLDDDVRQRRME